MSVKICWPICAYAPSAIRRSVTKASNDALLPARPRTVLAPSTLINGDKLLHQQRLDSMIVILITPFGPRTGCPKRVPRPNAIHRRVHRMTVKFPSGVRDPAVSTSVGPSSPAEPSAPRRWRLPDELHLRAVATHDPAVPSLRSSGRLRYSSAPGSDSKNRLTFAVGKFIFTVNGYLPTGPRRLGRSHAPGYR